MYRILALVAIVTLLHSSARAQIKPFSIGPYFEKAWMTGSAKTNFNDGWGLGLTADIKLPGRLGLTGSFGYMYADVAETQSGGISSVKAYPLRAGLKYRPLPFFYFKMEAGAAQVKGEDKKAFIVSPGVGIRVLAFDLQAKYEHWSAPRQLRFWGLRAAVNF